MTPADPFLSRIDAALEQRAASHLLRQRTSVRRLPKARIEVDGKQYHHFCSNDYLGLAEHPQVLNAWQQGLVQHGGGSGASPLVTGHHHAHAQLESTLCQWLGFEQALLFSSGFAANQAVLMALLDNGDLLLQDRLNHASLQEAGSLGDATMKRFRHNDLTHLETLLLNNADNAPTLVVTEGVFSMDGDCAPLAEIQRLCQAHNAWLMVDDAHGLGVLGRHGKGSCDAAGIQPDLLIVTFGKALGGSGAAVLCKKPIADYLLQRARHLIYSTALPPAQADAVSAAIKVIKSDPKPYAYISELKARFLAKLDNEIPVAASNSPILPLIVGSSEAAVMLSDKLKDAGFWVSAIRPPTVPKGSARLRITLSASHSNTQVDALADAINALWHSLPLKECQ